jgi:peptidoglycan/LPS O-acetylase OafA/YrhL
LISPYLFYKEINSQPITILFFIIIIIIISDIVNKYFEQPCNKLFKKN